MAHLNACFNCGHGVDKDIKNNMRIFECPECGFKWYNAPDVDTKIKELEDVILNIRCGLAIADGISVNTFISIVDGKLNEMFGEKGLKDRLEEKKKELLNSLGIFGKVN